MSVEGLELVPVTGIAGYGTRCWRRSAAAGRWSVVSCVVGSAHGWLGAVGFAAAQGRTARYQLRRAGRGPLQPGDSLAGCAGEAEPRRAACRLANDDPPTPPRTTSASSAPRRSLPPNAVAQESKTRPLRKDETRRRVGRTSEALEPARGRPPGAGWRFRRSRTRTRRCCVLPGRTRSRSGGPARPDAGTCPRSRAPESAPAPGLAASRPRP